jgi:2-keto-4-pentenoate hydratase/2-oxohepta-3-ene-1,7-dioic acid hydratase in catechol pathway
MRVARVRYKGRVHLARVNGDSVVLISAESVHPRADVMIDSIIDGTDLTAGGSRIPLAEVKLLAPVARPGKIIAVGLNYADHADESSMELPSTPLLFSKPATAIVGPGEPVRWSAADSSQADYEAELAVVIGTAASGQISDPMSHVFGYSCCNDFSARDAQFSDGQWVRGKSFDTFFPIGPWIVTPDEFGDPQDHAIGIDVADSAGGTVRLQNGNTRDMVFDIATIISYVARFMTLEPGDVIATGTPDGVGFSRTPPRYMGDGDVMTVWIDGIGELTNPCVVD